MQRGSPATTWAQSSIVTSDRDGQVPDQAAWADQSANAAMPNPMPRVIEVPRDMVTSQVQPAPVQWEAAQVSRRHDAAHAVAGTSPADEVVRAGLGA